MLKKIKDKLYFLKSWYQILFRYPQNTLNPRGLIYDDYWKEKRGDAVGALSDWQKIRADLIIRSLGKGNETSIGDIGCGGGATLAYLGKNIRLVQSTGYDVSDFALDKVKSLGFEAIKMDVSADGELEKVKKTDHLLLLEVLEHLPHSEKVLATAYEKSRRGIFFSFPNSGFFIYRLRLLFGKFPMQWRVYPNEHLRFWTVADLKWWLRAQGYTEYDIFFYKGIPLLNRLWPSLFAAGLFVCLTKR